MDPISRGAITLLLATSLACAKDGGDGGTSFGDLGENGDGDGDTGDGDTGDGDGDADSGDGDGDGDGTKFDMAPIPDGIDTGGDCLQCSVTLDSTQSSSFAPLQGTTYLGSATLPPDHI